VMSGSGREVPDRRLKKFGSTLGHSVGVATLGGSYNASAQDCALNGELDSSGQLRDEVVILMLHSFSDDSVRGEKGGGKSEESIEEGLSERLPQPTSSGGLELRSSSKPVKLGVSTRSGTIRDSTK
jgi:hypothetical protein